MNRKHELGKFQGYFIMICRFTVVSSQDPLIFLANVESCLHVYYDINSYHGTHPAHSQRTLLLMLDRSVSSLSSLSSFGRSRNCDNKPGIFTNIHCAALHCPCYDMEGGGLVVQDIIILEWVVKYRGEANSVHV